MKLPPIPESVYILARQRINEMIDMISRIDVVIMIIDGKNTIVTHEKTEIQKRINELQLFCDYYEKIFLN